MTISKRLNEKIQKRFDELIEQIVTLIETIKHEEDLYRRNHPYDPVVNGHNQRVAVHELKVKAQNLIRFVIADEQYVTELIRSTKANYTDVVSLEKTQATLRAIKSDYEFGSLEKISKHIISDLAVDYMKQAKQLLSEGQSGEYDHIPATVLACAVLENSLRNLCERNGIVILKENGEYITLNPLITELQKAEIINKAKANMLRSWAQMRNSAAHGHFDEVDASEVPAMIEGINKFIADVM